MKKAFLTLSVALLALTACHRSDDFDFLVGEQAIAVELFYDQIDYENSTVQRQFEQLLAGKQNAMETAFMDELNSELDDVMLYAYRHRMEDALPSYINYIFQVYPTYVTSHGVRDACVHVFDREGREQFAFTLQTRCELDYSFSERVFDSMDELGERMGENIRYGM